MILRDLIYYFCPRRFYSDIINMNIYTLLFLRARFVWLKHQKYTIMYTNTPHTRAVMPIITCSYDHFILWVKHKLLSNSVWRHLYCLFLLDDPHDYYLVRFTPISQYNPTISSTSWFSVRKVTQNFRNKKSKLPQKCLTRLPKIKLCTVISARTLTEIIQDNI